METTVNAVISANATGFVSGMRQSANAAQQFAGSLDASGRGLRTLTTLMGAATVSTVVFARQAFRAAASVAELDDTLGVVAKTTGVGEQQLRDTADAIQSMGIEMASARQIATKFAQNNLDLAQASRLARVAQDLAVVSQSNSTATLERLIHGIMTGNSLVLRNAGVVGMAGKAYADYAKELGVVATSLTPAQRQQAIINMIFKEGEAVAGAYEASMMNAGKVLRSFPRILNSISVAFGDLMLEGLNPLILGAYNLTKAFQESLMVTPKVNKETGEMYEKVGALVPVMDNLRQVFTGITEPITRAIEFLTNAWKSLSITGEQADALAGHVQRLLPIIAGLGAASSAAGANMLLGLVPGFSKLLPHISPLVTGLGFVVLTSTELQQSLMNLWESIQPVVAILAEFAAKIATGVVVALESLIPLVVGTIDAVAAMVQPFSDVASGLSRWDTSNIDRMGASADRTASLVRALGIAFLLSRSNAIRKIVTLRTLRVEMARAAAATTGLSRAQRVGAATSALLGRAFTVLKVKVRALMAATGFGLIVVGLGLMVEWMMRAWESSERFREKVEKAVNAVIGVIEGLTNIGIRAYNVLARLFGWGELDLLDLPEWEAAAIAVDEFADALEDVSVPEPPTEFVSGVEDAGEAAAGAARQVDYLAQAMERFEQRMERVRETVKQFDRWTDTIRDMRPAYESVMDAIAYETAQFDELMGDTKVSGDKLTQGFTNMASAIRSELSAALGEARQQLANAQREFDTFKLRIAGAITSVLNFRDALPTQEELYPEAPVEFTGFVKALDDALDGLRGPREALDTPAPRTFLDSLEEQAAKAASFGAKIQTLLSMGLSREAIQQVIDAGYEAGSAIADEIINGGLTMVNRVNELVRQTQELGLEVGTQGAETFYAAGVAMGASLVTAIEQTIMSQRDRLNRLVDDMVRRLEEIARLEALDAAAAAAAADGLEPLPTDWTDWRSTLDESALATLDSIGPMMDELLRGQIQAAQEAQSWSRARLGRLSPGMSGGYIVQDGAMVPLESARDVVLRQDLGQRVAQRSAAANFGSAAAVTIENMYVRDDTDVDRLALQLQYYIDQYGGTGG